ncbi:MAG: transposase, partial [Nitrospirae bacterium]|nr:transposase [Nitrospirota bacterium]
EEQKDYDEKMNARQEIENETGKKAKGRAPVRPKEGPKATDQVNLTDEESRIMPGKGGGFEQAYNAQAAVDVESLFIVENHISQCPNDKREVVPALEKITDLPDELGSVQQALLDSGYFSQTNVEAIENDGIIPYIAHKRDPHNTFLKEHIASTELPPEQEPVAESSTAVERMGDRMKTPEGKKLYAKRKSTIEPVFGIVKHVMGFRQFLLRGVANVSGEWNLVCTAFNIKRLHRCSVAS